MGKRWRLRHHDHDESSAFAERTGISPIVAQLLRGRGISDPESARAFLDTKLSSLRDPHELPGVTEAAARIFEAVQSSSRIVIYGDYDADGMTSTAILHGCLRLLGADVGCFVPNRMEEGYGLNEDALRKLADRGASLIVSVDCGIGSIDEADAAARLGLELIITDHHEIGDRLPIASAIVHPRLPGTDYPFGQLCGAGVAFKLAWAICQKASDAKRVSPHMRDFLIQAMSLAAIGTVADVVPLMDENRTLVRHGLVSLYEKPLPGLEALMKVTKLNQKRRLTSEDIAFMLAPRLNAAGRLGQAQLGVELLTTDSPDRAQALAEYIHQLNSSRESLERSIYLAANKQAKEEFDPVEDAALVLAGAGWHPGVIGIVAGRLAEKYSRPVVVIALDQMGAKPGCGSARSAGGVNLHATLAACTEHLISHGGHAAAAGLKISEGNVDAFRADFCERVATTVSEQNQVPEIDIDAEAPLSQLTLRTVEQIEQLAPFGEGNPRPILVADQVNLAEPPRRMGGGDRHLSAQLEQHGVKMRSVAFGQGDWADEMIQAASPIDIAYRPVINEFRGRRNVELHLVDWRVSQTVPLTQGK